MVARHTLMRTDGDYDDALPEEHEATASSRTSSPSTATSSTCSGEPVEAPEELTLLTHDFNLNDANFSHEVVTAPVITRSAYVASGLSEKHSQYGVLGSVLGIHDKEETYVPDDRRLYVNTNAPFSAIVCGVQGGGKSHTVSVLLESMLLANHPAIGLSQKPLCGLVLHYGEGGSSARPCEAAWLAKCDEGIEAPPIRVYVSRSSLSTMRKAYAPLGDAVTVEPLLFSENELDAQAILSMMAVESSEGAPLYVHRVLTILRDLGEGFSYSRFLAEVELAKKELNPNQVLGLDQRLVILKAFVGKSSTTEAREPRYKAGQLTIIDLSDPFVDPPSANALFEISTRQFVRLEVDTGKVLVVDEAHKYLSVNKGKSGLTNQLTSLIRQQRHLAMRIILSTQEPTAVPPVLIDLCSVAILHRFSSPAWWDAVAKHVSANLADHDAFDRVVKLKTGEALVLAPSGLVTLPTAKNMPLGECTLAHLGRRYLLVKTRKRVTADGGASRMVVESTAPL